MKCADPILCYTTQKGRIYRHFSLATPIIKLMHQQVFDCGQCIFCRKKRAKELAVRCVFHASLYKDNCFLTLTYDEQKTSYHNNFEYSDIQKFKKKLRRHCDPKRIQIFNVHEYGKNGKKHWHLVVFNHDFSDKILHTISNGNRLYKSATLEKLWKNGFCTIGNVTEASAMYQAQYTQKDVKNGNLRTAKAAHSKHAGIGRDYFLKHYAQILRLGYIPFGTQKIPVPRYFQKLAHKHYSHFYEQTNFFDLPHRKRLYTPFKQGQENKGIADLYIHYREQKNVLIEEISSQWEVDIQDYIYNKNKPDFAQAASNYLYDLANKKHEKDI